MLGGRGGGSPPEPAPRDPHLDHIHRAVLVARWANPQNYPKHGCKKITPKYGCKKDTPEIDPLLWPFRAHTMPGLVTATSLEDVTCMSKMFHTLRLARI